jgi:hypothetical protein
MNSKLTTTTAVLALAIASITLVVGLSQTDKITAADAPTGNEMYPFAEDVYPVATFTFKDATETHDFQLFTQSSGFGNTGRGATPEFVLQKVIGDTPYLHDTLKMTHERSNRAASGNSEWEFSVTVDLVQGQKTLISYEYNRCFITNYKVNTEYDKAESFTGKDAFAVLEQYTFTCGGYSIINTSYEQMMEDQQNRKPYQ